MRKPAAEIKALLAEDASAADIISQRMTELMRRGAEAEESGDLAAAASAFRSASLAGWLDA